MFVGGLYISFHDHHADGLRTDKYKARELQLFGCQKLQFSFLMFDEWMTNGASGRRWQWLGRLMGGNGLDA
jgi:hypothetical protein